MKKVSIGSKVFIEFENGEKETFEIVGSDEANPTKGKVSSESLFSRAIIGGSEGKAISYVNELNERINCRIIGVDY